MPLDGQDGQELEQQQDEGHVSLADVFADNALTSGQDDTEDGGDEADAEMQAGFSETRGEEPPEPSASSDAPVEDPATAEALKEAADAEAAAAAAAETPAQQPAAGAEPTAAQLLEQITALQSRVRNAEGHIGGINSTLKQSLAAAKAAATSAGGSGAAPSQADIAAAAASSEKLTQLCEDFPDFGEALKESLVIAERSILAKAGGGVDRDALRAEVRAEVLAEVAPLIKGEIEAVKAEAAVVAKYPDFHDRVKAPEFGQWLQKQAPEVRALADSTKAADAIALIDRHQKHVDTIAAAARKRNRLSNAVLPRGTAQGGPPVLDDDAALQAGYASVRGQR